MRQIIAMGGGGFSMEPDNLALDRYVLRQARRSNPRVCFVPTASGDADGYILGFYRAFTQLECRPSCLSLFRPPTGDLADFVLEKDVFYVGGGNTRNLLVLWREWGLDRLFRQAYEAGIVLAGISAGANCWFDQFTTDSTPGTLGVMKGLGFLPGSFSPHYDGEVERRPALHRFLQEGAIAAGLAAHDGAAAHFVDERPSRAVRSRPEARVYRVALVGGSISEESLEMTSLEASTTESGGG